MDRIGITFTHYTGPARRRVMRWIHRPKDIEDKAAAIVAAGGQFEVEDVSATDVRIACVHEGKAIAHRQARIIDKFVVEAVDFVVVKAHKILIERDP